MVWRERGSRRTIASTCGRKPMSSMRSASSRTRISICCSETSSRSLRSWRRPGVATRISAPLACFACRPTRHAAVDGLDPKTGGLGRTRAALRRPGPRAPASGRGRGRTAPLRPASFARRARGRRRASCPIRSATWRARRNRRARPAGRAPGSGRACGYRVAASASTTCGRTPSALKDSFDISVRLLGSGFEIRRLETPEGGTRSSISVRQGSAATYSTVAESPVGPAARAGPTVNVSARDDATTGAGRRSSPACPSRPARR